MGGPGARCAAGRGAAHDRPAARQARGPNRVLQLTSEEFDLLAFLARDRLEVFTRERLLPQVWAPSSDWQTTDTVTEHVRRVRKRLAPRGSRVVTVGGVGRRLDPPEAPGSLHEAAASGLSFAS